MEIIASAILGRSFFTFGLSRIIRFYLQVGAVSIKQDLQTRPREFRYLRLMRASVSSTREPMKSESRPSSETGPRACRQSGGAFDHEFIQTPLAKHASFSGSLVAEVSSLCISSVYLITLDFPQTERQRAASSHQRGSRIPRPAVPLAFWRRYSA